MSIKIFFKNPKYTCVPRRICKKKFKKAMDPPQYLGVKFFLKKISKHHISGVSCPILMILDSKWGFLRTRNWLASFPELQIWSGMSSTTPLSKIKDRSVLTRRMDTHKKVVFTKVTSNHTNWWYNKSEWSSRLTCPPQIQLQSRRTGAVLTRRMDTYKEVILTKHASNHIK